MEKRAGLKSEILGMVNPVNIAAAPISALVAALTKTKGAKAMVKQQGKTLSNILLPGAAPYRLWKRYGNAGKLIKDYDKKQALLRKLKKGAAVGAVGAGGVLGAKALMKKKKSGSGSEKTAGAVSQIIGKRTSSMTLPILGAVLAGPAGHGLGGVAGSAANVGGSLAGLLGKTSKKTLKEMSKAEKQVLKDLLIPGVAGKKIGRKLRFSHDKYKKLVK